MPELEKDIIVPDYCALLTTEDEEKGWNRVFCAIKNISIYFLALQLLGDYRQLQ